mgnify:CR=1 FL=1
MPRTKRDYAERLAEIEQRETAAKVKIDAIRAEKRRLQNREREKAVSYTHLTLPTIA